MKGTDFEGSTFDLVKPSDMTDEQCTPLRAASGTDNEGFSFILVAFKPSPEDLQAMIDGRPVFMKVLGQSFAPVSLYTLDENDNVNPQ